MSLTRQSISQKIAEQFDIPVAEAKRMVDGIIGEITSSLEAGQTVKLSNFGTFNVRPTPERIGRNPKTGEEVLIESGRRVQFTPSKMMRNRVRAQD